MRMELWDIGHSNRSFEQFLNILKKNGIELLIDVRSFPASKKFPHFNLDFLKSGLPKYMVEYKWLGEKLGGFRKGGYKEWIKTKEYAEGVTSLEEEALKKRTAIMCAEGYFELCHRAYIIQSFEERGWRIRHL